MRARLPSINILLVGMLVMMLGFSTCMFRMRMMVANKVGLFMIIGLLIIVGALARMGGEHKARRLAEEQRRKELASRRKNKKLPGKQK